MNEKELRELWEKEKKIYAALGEFVSKIICDDLKINNNIDTFLKIPVQARTKETSSLIYKAFYRDKNYTDPYHDITDKVGIRFVVLLREDIKTVQSIIEAIDIWTYSKDKDFFDDQKDNPKIFDYESVHYIVKIKEDLIFNKIKIPSKTPCEIQIRSLLQHACSELTHDAIYKSKISPRPEAIRSCSKAIALCEATDDCFMKAFEEIKISKEPLHTYLNKLTSIYKNKLKRDPDISRISYIIINALLHKINEDDWEKLTSLIDNSNYLVSEINTKYLSLQIYREPVVFLVYYFLRYKKNILRDIWPLTIKELEPLAADIGESLNE